MLSFNVAKQLSSVFLLETLKSSTNANTGEIALKKSPCETHGKVEYVVFKAQVEKKKNTKKLKNPLILDASLLDRKHQIPRT